MGKLKSIGDFVKIVQEVYQNNAKNFQQDFTTEIGGDIARLTPIDTGRATANWTGSINAPDTRPKKKYDATVSAFPTKQAIQKAVGSSKFGDVLYVSNGVQGEDDNGASTGSGYIQQLENGKSKQARNGMILINVNRADVIAKRALKK